MSIKQLFIIIFKSYYYSLNSTRKRHFAEELDRRDELADFRDLFHIPIISELLDEDEIAGGTT